MTSCARGLVLCGVLLIHGCPAAATATTARTEADFYGSTLAVGVANGPDGNQYVNIRCKQQVQLHAVCMPDSPTLVSA